MEDGLIVPVPAATLLFKTFRLSPGTIALLAAMRHVFRRRYLSYDELLDAMAWEYLRKRRSDMARVERILTSETEKPAGTDVIHEDTEDGDSTYPP